MNDCSISSQQHIRIWIDEVTFTKRLPCLLHCIYIKYDTKITFALSTDTSIHSQIKKTTVVSFLNDIFVPG